MPRRRALRLVCAVALAAALPDAASAAVRVTTAIEYGTARVAGRRTAFDRLLRVASARLRR